MRKIIAFIPNFITLCNITCGVLSIFAAFSGRLDYAFYLIILAAVFDFFDGFAARLLNARSDIGLQLDSLCDVVSFGVAPAVMATLGLSLSLGEYSFVSILLAPFAAYRLAVFNVDTTQSDEFRGLPTPAMALLVGSLIASGVALKVSFAPITVAIIIALCLLMVSRIPMFSFKFKSFSLSKNPLRYSFALYSVLILIFAPFELSIGLIIATYIAISLLLWVVSMTKKA